MQLKSIKFNAACISRISIFSRTICTRNERQRKKANEPLPAATHCRDAELRRAAELQWGSVGQQRHARALARCPGPGTSCLLPVASTAADVALRSWHRVASAANQFRFHLQFYSRWTGATRRQRGSEPGGQRFGGIFGNQSLDVIIGHINSALALASCIY